MCSCFRLAPAPKPSAPITAVEQARVAGQVPPARGPVSIPTPSVPLIEQNVTPPSQSPSVSQQPLVASPAAAPSPSIASASGLSPGLQQAPEVPPAEVPPQLDLSNLQPAPQISDQSLTSLIDNRANPARAASLRVVERARQELTVGHFDESIRMLTRALSIDASNPYAYFYIGRAYFMKRNYEQALTFFKRAAILFTGNPAWLAETHGFEGLAYETSGKLAEAAAAYKRALDLAPNNRVALLGYGRVAAVTAPAPILAAPAPGSEILPAGGLETAPPPNADSSGSLIQPPPQVAPPSPPPVPSD